MKLIQLILKKNNIYKYIYLYKKFLTYIIIIKNKFLIIIKYFYIIIK